MKDRLVELQTASRKLTRKRSNQTNLFMETMHEKAEKIDEFMAQCEQVNGDLNVLEQEVKRVDLEHAHLLSSPTVDIQVKGQLEARQQEITRSASNLKRRIEHIMADNKATVFLTSTFHTPTILRIRETQANLLQKRLIDLMTEYNRNQVSSRQQYKNKLKRQLDIIGQSSPATQKASYQALTDEQLDDMIEKGNVAVFTQGIDLETERYRQMLADVEARHAQILELEQSIKQLHALFVDMALLVHEQGHRIDNIEDHVRQARNHFDHGIKLVGEAIPLKRRANKLKYCVLSIVLVCLAFVVVILCVQFIPTSNASMSKTPQVMAQPSASSAQTV